MKRSINKLILVMGLTAGIFLLGSCLKNNKYYVDFSKYKPSMELPLAATNVNGLVPVPMGVINPTDTFEIVVNVASVNPLNTSQTATLALDTAFLDQYNTQQEQATQAAQAAYLAADTSNTVNDANYPPNYVPYELFPDSLYTINSWNLTVPAGQRQAHATITVNARGINTNYQYVLPFTIVQSSLAISSWNHLMLNIQQKNPYDDNYTNTYSGDLGSGKNTMYLKTVNPNTCSSNLIGVYSNPIYFVVNPDNSVTVLDALGSGNTTTTAPSSHYDPSTKTFYLDYEYYGAYHIVETLVGQ